MNGPLLVRVDFFLNEGLQTVIYIIRCPVKINKS